MIHIFIGTKAQYIKTAPVLRALDAVGVPYRLIDSGQHAHLMETLRPELGIRAPDYSLRQGQDISRLGGGLWWLARHLGRAWIAPTQIRTEIFGGQGGMCLIHGDTGSTLLAAWLAHRAGLRVAHLEAGLHSGSLWDPFPEELVRRVATRMSDLLLAPSMEAAEHLRRAGVRGAIINLGANTGVEATAFSLTRGRHPLPDLQGYLLVTIHRLETLSRRGRLAFVVDMILRAAARRPVVCVLHEPTRLALQRQGFLSRLESAGEVHVLALQPHADFLQLVSRADGVITDGGSVQEECAYLGAPCLVLRDHTERPDGVGENVSVVPFDASTVDRFIADPSPWRRPSQLADRQPSRLVVETLRAWEGRAAAAPTRRLSLGWVVSAGVLAWLAWLIVRETARVTVWPGLAAWSAWLPATVLLLASLAWAAWVWAGLARAAGVQVPARRLLRLWAQSLPAKYVPGGWWQVASRWYLMQQAGASSVTAMMAIVLEQVLIVLSSMVVLLVVWWMPGTGRMWPAATGGWWMALAAVTVATTAWWLPRGVRWAGQRAGLSLDVRTVPWPRLLRYGVGYPVYWVLSLVALASWVHGWPATTWVMAAAVAVAYVPAFLVGLFCPWAPAGLGVREGVLAWSISPLVGTATAAAIAISTRLWFMGTELIISVGLRWLTRDSDAPPSAKKRPGPFFAP